MQNGKVVVKPTKKNGKKYTGWGTGKFSPQKFRNQAIKYFEWADSQEGRVNPKTGEVTKHPKTLSGLCVYCGLSKTYLHQKVSREKERSKNALDGGHEDAFVMDDWTRTYEWVMNILENDVEEAMLTGEFTSAPSMFVLKNRFDWKEKVETANTNDNTFHVSFKDDLDAPKLDALSAPVNPALNAPTENGHIPSA